MTDVIVNPDTGEIIDAISADEARRLTTEAQNELRSSREHFDRAWSLIEQAVEGGGHVALGYRSAGDYLHSEFDGVLSGLDVSARRIAVRTMTEWGLSTRAIAPVVGVSKSQVATDVQVSSTGHLPPPLPTFDDHMDQFLSASEALAEITQTPAPSEGEAESREVADDETEAAVPEVADSPAAVQPERGEDPTPTPAPSITGIDGKRYKRTPQKARRIPRPAAERTLAAIQTQAAKAAREAQALTPDQIRRVRAEADHVVASLRNSIEVLQHLVNSLDTKESK